MVIAAYRCLWNPLDIEHFGHAEWGKKNGIHSDCAAGMIVAIYTLLFTINMDIWDNLAVHQRIILNLSYDYFTVKLSGLQTRATPISKGR